MGPIFAKAFMRAATLTNEKSGFRASGIVPFNPQKLTDEHFAPSELTERKQDNVTIYKNEDITDNQNSENQIDQHQISPKQKKDYQVIQNNNAQATFSVGEGCSQEMLVLLLFF